MARLGSAQINIELKNNKIIVRHTNTNGDILFSKEADNNTWQSIWNAIKE